VVGYRRTVIHSRRANFERTASELLGAEADLFPTLSHATSKSAPTWSPLKEESFFHDLVTLVLTLEHPLATVAQSSQTRAARRVIPRRIAISRSIKRTVVA
jgi:hypothetical protein